MPLPEAAALLGVTPDAVRARIRRGLLRGRKGNRTWLVELPADLRSVAGERPENDRTSPVTPGDGNGLAEAHLALAGLEERLRADGELRAALAEEQVARARVEGELAAEQRRNAELVATLTAALTKAEARADRLEAALAEARRPWLARVLEGLRRRGS